MTEDIDVLLSETRKFEPEPAFSHAAHVSSKDIYEKAAADPEHFWADQARALDWMTPWKTILEWTPPHAKWFVGGKLNVSANCLDRHIDGPRAHKKALIWEGEPGDERALTYAELHAEVMKFANVMKKLGVTKGDRVAIYMPLIPEAAVAMLACTRIGAIHSVVFGGFSPESLRDRINDSKCKLLITSDGGYRRGAMVPLKKNSDAALEGTDSIENVIVVKRALCGRTGKKIADAVADGAEMTPGRDHWYHELMKDAQPACPPEPMDA
ncbi:MAG: AMP-binding protein, partial [Gemmatimonadota bacterium]|nr:AMP-binding protein [Gemmatimonadota bacterium]